MHPNTTIAHRLFSLLLVALFALAITPAIVFHNALAGHHDENIQHHHTQSSEVAKAGINCHWDSMVCEQTFLNNMALIQIAPPIFGEAAPIAAYSCFFTQHHFFAELRGPPCC